MNLKKRISSKVGLEENNNRLKIWKKKNKGDEKYGDNEWGETWRKFLNNFLGKEIF